MCMWWQSLGAINAVAHQCVLYLRRISAFTTPLQAAHKSWATPVARSRAKDQKGAPSTQTKR